MKVTLFLNFTFKTYIENNWKGMFESILLYLMK